MKYDFDAAIERSYSAKWSEMDLRFGTNDLLPFWFADMDFRSPQPVIDALVKRAAEGVYGYTYRPESYYTAVCNWFYRRHSWKIERKNIIHSPGVIAAISIIIREMTAPGDKIVIQPPVYPPFFDVVSNNDRELVLNPLKIENGRYVMDYEDLERKIDPKVKLLILCSPHNPVGRVWEKDELVRLGEICLKNNIRIVSDEIHADIVYRGSRHIPIASISEELRNNCMTCIAPNKTFNLAGLQGASVVMPGEKELGIFDRATSTLDLKRNNAFSVVAAETAYNEGGEWYEQMLAYLEGNRAIVEAFFRDMPKGVKLWKPEGTYLLWVDFRALNLSREELHEKIIERGKIALDYGYRYGSEGFLRLSTGCTRGLLEKGLERLDAVLKRL